MIPESALYKLEGVKKDYRVGSVIVHALKSVSLELYPGEFVALQGPSGGGKSTLLNLLGFLEEPTAGTLSFCGRDVTRYCERDKTYLRRTSIGFVFQNFNLMPILSALENTEYPLYLEKKHGSREIRDRATETLKAVGLEKFASHRPAELSGGQRQRVAIARALIKRPAIIVADEPTANLDSQTSDQIMCLFMTLNQRFQTTILVATHDASLAAKAGRTIYLKDGLIETVSKNGPGD